MADMEVLGFLILKFVIIVLFLLLHVMYIKDTEYFWLVMAGVGWSLIGDLCMMWNHSYVGMGLLIVARLLYMGAFQWKCHSPLLATLPCILCCLLVFGARLEFKGGLFFVHVIVATVVACQAIAAWPNKGTFCNSAGSTVLMLANILYSVSNDFGIPYVNALSEIVSLIGHVAVMLSTFGDGHDAPIF